MNAATPPTLSILVPDEERKKDMTMFTRSCVRCGKAIGTDSIYCDRCGKKQPKYRNNPSNESRTSGIFIAIVVLGVVAALFYNGGDFVGFNTQDAKPTSTPFVAKSTAIPESTSSIAKNTGIPATRRPSMPMPPNGDVTKYTFAEHKAPFKVAVPSGSDYYYIILTESTDIQLKVVSLLVHPGETVEIMVPLGNYKMFYATGTQWYGKSDLFGEETTRYQADDILAFYDVSGNQVMGHTVELIKQVGGNLETFTVKEENFPI